MRAVVAGAWVLVAAGCARPPSEPARPRAELTPRAPELAASALEPPAEASAAPTESSAVPSQTASPQAEPPPKPRALSVGYFTWIWPTPKADGRFLGQVRIGESVALKSTELVRGVQCSRGFYAIEPRGYVCADRTVTIDPTPRERAIAEAMAPRKGAFPYRYGLSNGAPMYSRVPTASEQKRKEGIYGPAGRWRKLSPGLRAHEDLAVSEPIALDAERPSFLAGKESPFAERQDLVKDEIPLGSMLSFSRAFEAEGRTWLLSSDLTLVPADRVRPFKPSAFHGTKLGAGVELPIAWMRATEKKKRVRRGPGAFEVTSDAWPARAFVMLAAGREEAGGEAFLETKEKDASGGALWILEADATVVKARDTLAFGVKDREKWLIVSITQGTLVAYEGLTPVYATLVSPGAGGVPVKGGDAVKNSTTPLGTYHITYKDKAATMSPEKGDHRSFWIADVPYTQYFNPPFALHAAYWHERFGEPTSAGCVNLSPLDAEALFAWTDPAVPEGWGGATGAPAPENGPMTAVVIAR